MGNPSKSLLHSILTLLLNVTWLDLFRSTAKLDSNPVPSQNPIDFHQTFLMAFHQTALDLGENPLPVARSVLLFISILMILALKILIPSQEDDDALQKTLEKNPGYPITETERIFRSTVFRVVFQVTPFPATWKRWSSASFSTKKPRGIHKTAFLGAVVMLRGFSSNRMVTFLVQSFLPPADLQEHLRRILRLSK